MTRARRAIVRRPIEYGFGAVLVVTLAFGIRSEALTIGRSWSLYAGGPLLWIVAVASAVYIVSRLAKIDAARRLDRQVPLVALMNLYDGLGPDGFCEQIENPPDHAGDISFELSADEISHLALEVETLCLARRRAR